MYLKLITFLFQRHFHTHTKLLKSMGAFGGSLNSLFLVWILGHTTGALKYTAKSLVGVKEELESTLHGPAAQSNCRSSELSKLELHVLSWLISWSRNHYKDQDFTSCCQHVLTIVDTVREADGISQVSHGSLH